MNRKLLVALLLSVSLLPLGGFAVSGQDTSTGPDPDQPVVEQWRFTAFDPESWFSWGPVVFDDTVYIGSGVSDFYAVDRQTGQQRWSFKVEDWGTSAPAMADGVVYIVCNRSLCAIDAASGQLRWSFGPSDFNSDSPPVVVDGAVYSVSLDEILYSIDAESGQQRWSFTTGESLNFSSDVVNGTVYVASGDGNLYALDANSGQKLWSFTVGGSIPVTAAVNNGVIYIVNGWVGDKLYAVDAESGQQLWSYTSEVGIISTPWVVDGSVYFLGGFEGVLYAIDALSGDQRWKTTPVITPEVGEQYSFGFYTVVDGLALFGISGTLYAVDPESGRQLWSFAPEGGIGGYESPVVSGDVVYVGSLSGNLYAVDAKSGQQYWAFTTDDFIEYAPAVVEGVVYVTSHDGNLYAIGNLAPDAQTATAEAQAPALTSIAGIHASATSEAVAAEAATATAEAIEQSWDDYFGSTGSTISQSAGSLPGVTIDTDPQSCPEEQIPSSFMYCESYEADISGGSADTWTALAIYPSNDEATAAFDQMKGGLQRLGWQEQDVDGLDHDHVCLTLVHDETSQGICYITRDDALIVSYSYLDVDAPDAALQNAVDLAKLMNDAYDQTDRPA